MRVYLDNAATSWPKPECVYEAVDRCQREVGAAAGRGAYRHAIEAQKLVDDARRGCAELLGVADPSRIVFGCNGTDVLNQAIHGILRPGDHVVSTVCEHNSVLRPLAEAKRQSEVQTTLVDCDADGRIDPDEVAAALTAKTRLVAVTHASNVTGALQPVAEIAQLARQHGAVTLVDAAQTVGHLPVDVEQLGVDLLAASGHKGLLGPLGTGLLYVRPGIEPQLRPMRQGGTGIDSQSETQPAALPHRYEAGNLNVPALAGLAAATSFLLDRDPTAIAQHESALTCRLVQGLSRTEGIELYGPRKDDRRTGVVSFAVAGYDPQELAAMLDASCSIQCRAGLHCAPLLHRALGSVDSGGLVRVSVGWSTATEDVDRTLSAIRDVIAAG